MSIVNHSINYVSRDNKILCCYSSGGFLINAFSYQDVEPKQIVKDFGYSKIIINVLLDEKAFEQVLFGALNSNKLTRC
jgi:hypothetical protein